MCGPTCSCHDCRAGLAHMTVSQPVLEHLHRTVSHSARARSVVERMMAAGDPSYHPDDDTEMTVNVRSLWRMTAEHTYKGSDLPFIATRETLQNGIDAIKRLALFASRMGATSLDEARTMLGKSARGPDGALVTVDGEREAKFNEWMKRKDKELPDRSKFLAEGQFKVTLDRAAGTLTWSDNGLGMTAETLSEKFLKLGESGKTESGMEGEVGGFGIAKAVILGLGAQGWEIHTRNLIAEPRPGTMKVGRRLAEMFPGTQITARGVPLDDREVPGLGGMRLSLEDRVLYTLQASDLGQITATFNGERVEPWFPKDKGSVVKQVEDFHWGAGTTVRVKRYRRQFGAGGGAFYVRLGGLFQFAEAPEGEEMDSDIILDVTTTARPDGSDYPFTPSRESLRGTADSAFYRLRRRFAVDQQSVKEDRDYTVYLPDSTDPKERAGAERFAEQMASLYDDPTYRALAGDLLGQKMDDWALTETDVRELEKGMSGESKAAAVAAEAPAATEAGWGWVFKNLPDSIAVGAPEDVVTKAVRTIEHVADWAAGTLNVDVDAIRQAARDLQNRGSTYASTATDAMQQVADIAKALGQQTDATPAGVDSTGLTAGAALGQIAKLIEDTAAANPYVTAEQVEEVKKKRSRINPFGSAALIKVSAVNYDLDKAKAFRRGAKKFIPMLVAWEAACKLIAIEYDKNLRAAKSIGVAKKTFSKNEERTYGKTEVTVSVEDVDRAIPPFKVGFVLDDTCLAMASNEPGYGKFVLVHPDRLAEVVEHHRERPGAIAGYIHATICHELAHLPRMGKGHNENYVIAREDIDVKTTHLLPVIERIITKAFKIKSKTPPGAEAAVRGASWKATKAANDRWSTEVARLGAELAATRAEVERLTGLAGGDAIAIQATADKRISELTDELAAAERRRAEWEAQVYELRTQNLDAEHRVEAAEAERDAANLTAATAAAGVRAQLAAVEQRAKNLEGMRRDAGVRAFQAESRAQALSRGFEERATGVIQRLEALADYGDYRTFLRQHGAGFLPMAPDEFLAAIESDRDLAAALLAEFLPKEPAAPPVTAAVVEPLHTYH